MPNHNQIPNSKTKEVAAFMEVLANYHGELITDDAFEIAYAFCDLLHECSVDEVLRCFKEKISEVKYYGVDEDDEEDDYDEYDDEPEDKNTKSIQNNGVVNIPSDYTNFLFNLSNHGIRKNADLYIYEDPEDKGAFIIVAEKNPIFKVGQKIVYPKALNEFFSIGFQNRNLNPTLRRLKVKMKTYGQFGIDFSSNVKFDKCWRTEYTRNQTIPAIKVVFF